jgi:hydrogenase maturation protease
VTWKCEQAVRNYDPCISCATHFLRLRIRAGVTVLILGCGNAARADDVAGLLVARRLQDLGIDAREHKGEMLSLIDAWFYPLPPGRFRRSTHSLGIAEAVELARALDRLPPRLTLYGIEGTCFDQGGHPSPEAVEAVERLARRIAISASTCRGCDTV